MYNENMIEYAKGNEDIETIWDNLKRGIGIIKIGPGIEINQDSFHALSSMFAIGDENAEKHRLEQLIHRLEQLIQRLEDPSTKLGSWYEMFFQKVEDKLERKRYIRELVECIAGNNEFVDKEEYIERLLEGSDVTSGTEQKRNQAAALNQLLKEFSEEEKSGILCRIEQLEQLLCILKKNIQGGLQLEDVEALEKNLPNWKKQIRLMKACLEQME